jgi:hypothetical protein
MEMEKVKTWIQNNKKIWIPAVILLILLLVAGIYFFLQPYEKNTPKTAQQTSEIETTMETTSKEEQKTENDQSEQTIKDTQQSKEDHKTENTSNTLSVTSSDSSNSSGNNSSGTKKDNTSGNTTNTASKPAGSVHQHVWKDHTAQKWVSKMVTVDDYETKTIYGARFYVYNGTNDLGQPTYIAKGPTYWLENGFTMEDLEDLIYNGIKNADENGLYNGVYYGNYQNVTKTEQVKVGSHQEDQGYYETYVDYQYCDCGAKK